MRLPGIAALLPAAFLLAAAGAGRGAVDRAAWSADYARIKAGMARHYANLDWVRDHRGLDLAALDRRTRARLDAASSDIAARLALADFVAAFRDPHLELAERGPSRGDEAKADPLAGSDCAAAGYSDSRLGFAGHFALVEGWRPLAKGAFATARVGDTGLIRIASFREQDYGAACRRVFRPAMRERALQIAVRAELQRQLAAAIGSLRKRGVRRLIVDVTGNGGGSEWVREAVALFTGRVMRRAAPRIANPACDRQSVWAGERPCPAFEGPAGASTIAGTGTWTGPVWVLADGGTASAAEEFAAWLSDNRIALLAGQSGYGAGCGYINGGAPVRLRAAPLILRMPNCARFFASGRNEIEGWSPDIALPRARDDPAGWARQLGAALARGEGR